MLLRAGGAWSLPGARVKYIGNWEDTSTVIGVSGLSPPHHYAHCILIFSSLHCIEIPARHRILPLHTGNSL